MKQIQQFKYYYLNEYHKGIEKLKVPQSSLLEKKVKTSTKHKKEVKRTDIQIGKINLKSYSVEN